MWTLRPASQPNFKTKQRGNYKNRKSETWLESSSSAQEVSPMQCSSILFIRTFSHSNMRKCFVGMLSVCRRDRTVKREEDGLQKWAVLGRNVDKWKAWVFTKFTNNNHLMNMNGKCHAVPQRGCLLLYDSSQWSHNRAHHKPENDFVNGLIVYSVLTGVVG